MSVIPFAQREVILCPPSIRADARRALADRLARLAEEVANCRHRALEIEEAELAAELALTSESVSIARVWLEPAP